MEKMTYPLLFLPDTVQLHYGKHHQAYFNMLNTLAEGTKYNEMSLEDVVVESF
jgi:Superoxide dismutase